MIHADELVLVIIITSGIAHCHCDFIGIHTNGDVFPGAFVNDICYDVNNFTFQVKTSCKIS